MESYEGDRFLPIMVFYDGTPEKTRAFAEEAGLTFPVLSDPDRVLFDRWNEAGATPSTTMLGRGVRVHEIDTTWYPAMIEELLEAE